MKIIRAHFKRNKRLCEFFFETLKAERLASNLCNNDFKNFWKDIKHMNNVRWCYSFSEFFTVSNSVKQGGILSPHLFNVYMDDLSVHLNKLQIGCLYAGPIMNHMMYADDLCVFSPSVAG